LGRLDGTIVGNSPDPNENMLHGSSSQYVIFRSSKCHEFGLVTCRISCSHLKCYSRKESKRPIYSPAQASIKAAIETAAKAREEEEEAALDAENKKRINMSKSFASDTRSAPRNAVGELIVRRREIHSGRTMSVSTVEWSVAEKMAQPTSTLELFMWEKETQVDRLRERISLALLLSQCKMSMADPTKPKPRDWIGPVKEAGADGKFVIIPVRTLLVICKRRLSHLIL
jgi:hypothetical protein